MLVVGSDGVLLTDPSIDIHARGGVPGHGTVDRVLISHAHEDHVAGVGCFPDSPIHMHTHDLPALHNIESFLDVYGMPEPARSVWKQQLYTDFHYTARPDATDFTDGQVFDLGGRTVTVIHLPGHTRGHCGFLVEPDGVFFVADIDLSTFGPYYGDHWSDLEDFERAMDRCTEVDANWFVTSHHKGVVEGRDNFLSALSSFRSVIASREERLLSFLAEPRTMQELIAYRIIYRPDTTGLLWIDHVEANSIQMHLRRLERTGAVTRLGNEQYRAA
jgi:hydroxyacylglutathione hydrolase